MNEYFPSACALYDVVELSGKLYRILPTLLPDVPRVDKMPCHPKYWALPRWRPKEAVMKSLTPNSPRLQVLARFAKDLAGLSKCEDRGVAALIVNEDGTQIYSMGINGGPKGGPQCLCALGDKYTCIHAEANAIAKCTSTDERKVMICTLAPCITCASLMANAGVFRVFYLEDYKDNKGIALLQSLGIACYRLELN